MNQFPSSVVKWQGSILRAGLGFSAQPLPDVPLGTLYCSAGVSAPKSVSSHPNQTQNAQQTEAGASR